MHKPIDMHTESMLFKELRGGAALRSAGSTYFTVW